MPDDKEPTGRRRGTEATRAAMTGRSAPNTADRAYALDVAARHLDEAKLREFRSWMMRGGRTRGQLLGMLKRWQPDAELPGTPKADR
jgi:hypothetical protein